MADPIKQWALWFGEMLATFGPLLALTLGLYWAWLLWNRLRDDTDPSYRKFSSTSVGSASFVVSGSYVSALLALTIGFLLWVAGMLTAAVGAVLLAGVVGHVWLEKREEMGREPVIDDD